MYAEFTFLPTYLVVFCEYSSILSNMSSEPTVKFLANDDNIAIVTLSRPKVANALNSKMALELKDIFSKLSNKNHRIRVVILTGEGQKAFCAGADLKERHNMDFHAWQIQHQLFKVTLQTIMECPIPVIAAVNGAAYGGGLELALACDFIYAAKSAHFALPEATLGIMPGMGGTQNLPRAVGLRRAKEILFTGSSFSAKEAYSWGIINKLCEPDNLIEETLDCAKIITKAAPASVTAIKRVASSSIHLPVNEAMVAESNHYNLLLNTKDRSEGINAFNEKRAPVFTGK